jgi:hypothetical protein
MTIAESDFRCWATAAQIEAVPCPQPEKPDAASPARPLVNPPKLA